MLREGKYAAYYEKACREAEKAKATELRPLEFTHVMIDEAGQVSTLLTYACVFLVFLSRHAVSSPPFGFLLPSCSIITALWCPLAVLGHYYPVLTDTDRM